jgi:hypothetical protein
MLQPPGARRLLQASEAQPWMAGALVEVFWEAPDSSQPPTGWYTARVQKMSQRGASQLHYEQSNAIETLDAKDLMVRTASESVCLLLMLSCATCALRRTSSAEGSSRCCRCRRAARSSSSCSSWRLWRR